ncbi:MAG: hypothetical protein ABH867_01200 [Patescibacteria group bacterium]
MIQMTSKDRPTKGTGFVYPTKLLGKEEVSLRGDRKAWVWVYEELPGGGVIGQTGRIACRGGSEILDFEGAERTDFQSCLRSRIMLRPAKSGPKSKTRFVSGGQILAERAIEIREAEAIRLRAVDRPEAGHEGGRAFKSIEELKAERSRLVKLLRSS